MPEVPNGIWEEAPIREHKSPHQGRVLKNPKPPFPVSDWDGHFLHHPGLGNRDRGNREAVRRETD